jgi:tetratricopeptide (TPR) repeat protein
MALDPYSSCPCGSGKKFKWCCQPIYVGVNRAFEQETQGQHEAALRIMDEVIAEHGGNPEAWGKKAQLLYGRGQVEEAEAALEKAFALNPNYPFGLLLKALFRRAEGELPGALILARRAAEAYDPEARDHLSEVYLLIFDTELKLNRPVAARAALRVAMHCQPASEELRQNFEAMFGDKSRLPACARREYTLVPPAGSSGDRRAAWDKALQNAAGSPRLSELPRSFDDIVLKDPSDAAGWFNLGLTRAWLGSNAMALEALDRYLELEPDEARATTAAALAEVLRCGQGMADLCDYHEYSFLVQYGDPQPVIGLVEEWRRAGRLVIPQSQQEGALFAIVLEFTTTTLLTAGAPPADAGRMAAYIMVAGDVLRVWGPNKERFERVRDEVKKRLGLGIGEAQDYVSAPAFQDVASEALIFPVRGSDGEAAAKVRAQAERYYEEKWIHQPRKSLSGLAPVDVVSHPVRRKKLRGVIQFIQDCAAGGPIGDYEFDRLRRKLGLLEGTAGEAEGGKPAVAGLGATELAGLKPEELNDDQLEEAFHAAQKADAEDLAAAFARALAARPPRPDRPDLYSVFSFLTQHALKQGEGAAALDLVSEGQRLDCEHNEGRRRNDYELRRGQVHVKQKEADAAHDVFRRLIERAPDELKYRGNAAEAMLALKQTERALRFAEEGVEAARKQDDRDSEQYLMELAGAARKQMG